MDVRMDGYSHRIGVYIPEKISTGSVPAKKESPGGVVGQ